MVVVLLFIAYGICALTMPNKICRIIKNDGAELSDKALRLIRISGIIALIIAVWFITALF